MMKKKRIKIKNKMLSGLGRKTVKTGIRICVECGSTLISMEKNKISCKDCGSQRRFKNELFKSKFKTGDAVRIIDSENNSKLIFKIKKVKKSYDGLIYYLLKSESSDIALLYHENEESYLEKLN